MSEPIRARGVLPCVPQVGVALGTKRRKAAGDKSSEALDLAPVLPENRMTFGVRGLLEIEQGNRPSRKAAREAEGMFSQGTVRRWPRQALL